MAIVDVGDATFEKEVLRSELPVLVDLYADWCAPCKQLTPVLDQLSSELSGKLKVVRVDVERNPMLAQAFRVQSIPMLLLLHDGRVRDQRVGLVDKASLLAMAKPFLPASAGEVTPAELAQLLSARRAVPVDIRDAQAFARYRVPTAIHIAANAVIEKAKELLPTDGRLRVLYGRTTDEAKELAEQLRKQGADVAFLAGGFLHWEADGLEVERGN